MFTSTCLLLCCRCVLLDSLTFDVCWYTIECCWLFRHCLPTGLVVLVLGFGVCLGFIYLLVGICFVVLFAAVCRGFCFLW